MSGVAAIAATYIYFLLFAQFAFLEIAKSGFRSSQDLTLLMAAMGISGLVSSLLTAWLQRIVSSLFLLRIGLLASALIAVLSAQENDFSRLLVLSSGIGAFLGCLTVSLATSLEQFFPRRHLGLSVATGTGIAYFVCNIPIVFTATSAYQAYFVAAVLLLALAIVGGKSSDNVDLHPPYSATKADNQLFGFSLVVLSFAMLVWFDSAAFYVIQQTTGLKAATWENDAQLWRNGVLHFLAAIAAGISIDRGNLSRLFVAAWVCLAAGVLALTDQSFWWLAAPSYVIGVSIYSTALVAFPSLAPDTTEVIARRYRAGILFAIAGWFGSAMGIGMAQDLKHVPLEFIFVSGFLILFAALLRHYQGSMCRVVFGLILAAAPVFFLTAIIRFGEFRIPQIDVELKDAASRGRQVYIQEGCIHCHSQYVRPDSLDTMLWGKASNLDLVLHQTPPLIGERRQGPDLANVGLRRTSDWQREHLMNPRKFVPTSLMPSYKHLFQDSRGEDLVAYLSTLGNESVEPSASSGLPGGTE